MKVVKRTAEFTIYQKRSERYAVQSAEKQWVNGDDKARILIAEGLIDVKLPEPKVEEEAPAAEEEPAAEVEAPAAEVEAPAAEVEEPAAEAEAEPAAAAETDDSAAADASSDGDTAEAE